jgi:branched-chain amino acid transport system permease protein
MELAGELRYAIFFLTLAGIYGVSVLGLNLQCGFSGQFNLGVAGFWAVGAYTTAILTTPPGGAHLGGFALPVVAGFAAAALLCAVLAILIGLVTIRLRTDYLAIATLGIAEILRLVLKNEAWLTNGVRGIPAIPLPFGFADRDVRSIAFLALVVAVIGLVYLASERARRSPWGRAQRAIRDNEAAARAAGKHVERFRLEAFVLGAAAMGLGGALYAHFVGFISPEAFDPLFTTFVVWAMLIVGGSGNNRGALLGAAIVWGIVSGTRFLTDQLPADLATRAGPIRVLLIGALLLAVLLWRPQGVLPERAGDGACDEAAPPPGRRG